MKALVEAAKAPDYPAEIAVIIANEPEAAGLEFAKAQGIAEECVDHRAFANKAGFEAELAARLQAHDVQVVALAGFMRVLSANFIRHYEGRIVNIHPSLLPKFKGLHTHERAISENVSEHGCTVHLVTAELDDGPILAQARVAVLPDDTVHSLSARVLEQEHIIYPQALAEFCTSSV
jgi:phosphoribosylglycinamide formyltransferase-1